MSMNPAKDTLISERKETPKATQFIRVCGWLAAISVVTAGCALPQSIQSDSRTITQTATNLMVRLEQTLGHVDHTLDAMATAAVSVTNVTKAAATRIDASTVHSNERSEMLKSMFNQVWPAVATAVVGWLSAKHHSKRKTKETNNEETMARRVAAVRG